MAAFGELLIYFIYGVLILFCVIFLSETILSKKKKSKFIFGFLTVLTGSCIFLFDQHLSSVKRNNDLSIVGSYYLTSYPKCKSCEIILNENYTFEVTDGDSIFERGDWLYKTGGDYWITYLNKKKDRLGNGVYEYSSYKLKNETQAEKH